MLTVDKCGGIELASFLRWQPVLPSPSCIILVPFAAVDTLQHGEQAEHHPHAHGLQMGGELPLYRGDCARLFARASTPLCCFPVLQPLPGGAPSLFDSSSFGLPASELLPFCCVIPRLFRHDSACDLVAAGIVADYVAAGAGRGCVAGA